MRIRLALPTVAEIRAVKTAKEIKYIKQAQAISEKVLREVLNYLRVGITEKAVVDFIVTRYKLHGARALAFPPIVAFGKGTADVHHKPSPVKLKEGDIVMLDFGCSVNHYCSDMTRTFFFGSSPLSKFIKVYESVLKAQEKVLTALAGGERRARVLDRLARNSLTKRFGKKAFTHGLGHGVGTAIHEWPNLKPNSPDVLKPGMVVTVEPGLYLKGWGGVRIEDMVLITRRGARNLTQAPKIPVLQTKIMVFGTFDGLHKGHLNFFRQARRLAKNSFLIVSVARDVNVQLIKGCKPNKGERIRVDEVKKYPFVNKVVLSGIKNHLPHILKEKPEIIALGYDQSAYTVNLKKKLAQAGLKNLKIIRLKPYRPDLYKSSLFKNEQK